MPDTAQPTSAPAEISLPTIDDILTAAERLKGQAVRTPLLESSLLNDRLGGRLLLKPECLQRTGSFKFRGAYNTIAALPDEVRKRGVVAYSSGNHAQGVAAAAQAMGISATIVMPADAPAIKTNNTKAYGAKVIHYDRFTEDRDAIAKRIADDEGATLVPPYDHPMVIAGQGTVGLEIAEDCEKLGVTPDAVLICCGGGGFTAGVSIATTDRLPGTELYAVEPHDFDDTARSLGTGTREVVPAGNRSICDALLSPQPGALTFQINHRLLSGALSATDGEVLFAMRTLFEDLKLVAEPGGAVCVAAILAGKIDIRGKVMVATISGGNVDPELFTRALIPKPAA